MNKLFAWDELDPRIMERDPENMFRCNAEGGWVSDGWLVLDERYGNAYGEPVVEIRTNGRHQGLETWCQSAKKAHRLFMHSEVYREWYEDQPLKQVENTDTYEK